MKHYCLGFVMSALLVTATGRDSAADESDVAASSDPNIAVAAEISALEQRRQRIRDSNDIKRLQRAYGYYVDHALWDEVADLFAANGSIEIGLDGIYLGKERVREYLYALGDGRAGLAEGELNEHMQLMPVVTVAADGTTAKARWEGIVMAGRLGESALWGQGPYENEYVKEDGVWKIARLHWYQTFLVPYEGGWAHNEDINGGKAVSDRLPPDAPPTIEYEPWPATYLPPFHFDNPVAQARPAAASLADTAPAENAPAENAPADNDAAASLEPRAAQLLHDIQLLEDENEIENLQRIYGFYIEEGLWSEAADLFADDGTLEIAGQGIYDGRDRILDYLRAIDEEFPQDGRLYDQLQLQPIINVAPDGQTAHGRWRLFAQEAQHGEFAEWGVGWYENDYIKQDGVWKIHNLRSFIRMYTPYEDGWGQTALEAPTYSAALEPDRPSSITHAPYPAVPSPAFHYAHPVTGGRPVSHQPVAASVPAGPEGLAEALADAERRIGLLEDADQVERLHAAYGYYLARYQMDNLAALFAEDGTIEIALRGVYAGRPSVRRNLDLYAKWDQHNHMQFQPVIHVAPDGMSANMRSHAFSIMGNYGQFGTWMGGVYENEFVKRDGVWQISKDHVMNTYMADYDAGWQDLPQRSPPGITADNPPDSPPSVQFEMYPKAFLPPFHYDHPVTGRPPVSADPAAPADEELRAE